MATPAFAPPDGLAAFPRAWPALVAARDIQERSESKFVVPALAVAALLPMLQPHCAVLPAADALVAHYESLYFDTRELSLYHAHRRGRRVRHKVRIRHYPERRLSFLEIKIRHSEQHSRKVRRQRDFGDNVLSSADRAFLHSEGGLGDELVPQAWVAYRRVTLLGLRCAERVTIDTHVRMWRATGCGQLPHTAVVEVKQARLDRSTPAMRAMHAIGWREGWASKYVASIALTSPEVPAHRFLPRLRVLQAAAAWTH